MGKKRQKKQGGLLDVLGKLVDFKAVGNPENPLKWTSKSDRKLSKSLITKAIDFATKRFQLY